MDQPQAKEGRKPKSNRSPPYALFNLLVIIVAVVYGAYYQMYLSKDPAANEPAIDDTQSEDNTENIPLFTADELKKFDGVSEYHSNIKEIS